MLVLSVWFNLTRLVRGLLDRLSLLTPFIITFQVDIISNHQHNITESYSAQFDSLMEKIGELQV